MKITKISMTEDNAFRYDEALQELVETCSLSNGKFDFDKARKIALGHGFTDPDATSIVNHANSERKITESMIEQASDQMRYRGFHGSEIAEWGKNIFDLSHEKSWELAGLVMSKLNRAEGILQNHSIINLPSRGKMHRCNFCWMDVDKTDNGYKPYVKGQKYTHADNCPYKGGF